MRRRIWVLLLSAIALCAFAQTPRGTRVLVNGKWGLVGSDGKLVVEPRYDLIYRYHNGYTVAIQGGKRAYLDADGRLITPFAFDTAYHFFNELAPVEVGGKYGLLGKDGKLVVDYTLQYPMDYGSFYIASSAADGTRMVFNDRGQMIARIDADYWAGDFDATTQLIVKENGSWGVLDRTGEAVVPFEYTNLSRIGADTYVAMKGQSLTRILSRAGATLYQTTAGRVTDYYAGYLVTYDPALKVFGLIDTGGAQVLPPSFSELYVNDAGMAVGAVGAWGNRTLTLLDLSTKLQTVIDGNFLSAFDENGLSVFLARNGKYGVLARNGRIVAPAEYEELSPYSEGLALVRVGAKYGYLDTAGRMAILPQFDFAADFSEGLAVVRVGPYQGGKRGYIGKDGSYVIQPRFDWAYSFSNGMAHVAFGDFRTGTFGYVNRQGGYIWDPSH